MKDFWQSCGFHLLDRGEGVFELLRRRHADQDGAHRRVR